MPGALERSPRGVEPGGDGWAENRESVVSRHALTRAPAGDAAAVDAQRRPQAANSVGSRLDHHVKGRRCGYAKVPQAAFGESLPQRLRTRLRP